MIGRRARSVVALTITGLVALFGAVGPGAAQQIGVVQSEILVIDPSRLFDETELGKKMLADHQAAREALAARNRKIEAELKAEEQRLTKERAHTPAKEFRDLADAFNTKVQKIRRDSERRVRDLKRERERLPVEFMHRVEPVLSEIMRKAGGVVMLDARKVLFRVDAIDVTDAAIALIDLKIGAESPAQSPPGSPAPEPPTGAQNGN